MAKLHLEPRIQNPDAVYKLLSKLHEGLTAEQSLLIDAKLVLLLANHIGDQEVLAEAASRAGVAAKR